MAGTRWAYVRAFEQPDPVLPHAYMVVRLDGNGFHRFARHHGFAKPNDARALELMNAAAGRVMAALKGDALLAFGESDEYSFLLDKQSQLYSRRQAKITTHVVSIFTAAYVHLWPRYFSHPLDSVDALPSFDGRLVVYPTAREVRDYFSWRQADTHINNLYNTAFWTLVQHDGLPEPKAHQALEKSVSADKHNMLFQRGINYNAEPAIFRKGSILLWHTSPGSAEPKTALPKPELKSEPEAATSALVRQGQGKTKKLTKADKKALQPNKATELRTMHVDLIGDAFWSLPPANAPSSPPAQLADEADATQPWLDPRRLDLSVTAYGILK